MIVKNAHLDCKECTYCMHSLQSVKRGVKNTQIKIAIKMLVRNNQTLEEISEIVCLNLNTLRESKKCI